ncbi:sensor histidine kinase [Nocardioides agariphilus]|uniref:histidine kinase n=1 Tax=Nocardioides agariphilus TaxID=433664 RepID=A0A930VKK9_9ACTN|nr:sensor histidine kinase [Nocardioides agariphilus]
MTQGGYDVRERIVVPALFPVVTVLLLAITAALDVATPASGPGVELASGPGWPFAGLGVVFGVCAGVVLALVRGSDPRRFGWLLGGLGVVWGLDALAQSWVRYGIRPDEALPGAGTALWFLNRFGAFLPMTVAALLLVFPTGRFLVGRWGTAGRAALGVMAASGLLVIVAPANGLIAEVDVPAGLDLDAGALPLPAGLADAVLPIANTLTLVGVLVAMASAVVRHRRAVGAERDRTRWLLWSVEVGAVALAFSLFSDLGFINDVVLFVVVVLPGVAVTIGIVRPGLVPVEDLLNATLVFAVLSVSLVAVDLLVVAGLSAVLGDNLDERQVVVVVLLLTAVLYGPLRQRLSATVRRVLLGQREAPYDVVAGLASTLERSDEAGEQLAAVTDAVATAFRIGFVRLEVDRPSGERLVAVHGNEPAEVRTLPITYREREVGRVVLPVRGLRSRLSGRDEQLLADLVRQAASAVRTGQLAEELQESRERLVVAREEERRRIRRDLHDGLGPSLSGIVYQLESARLLVGKDPAGAECTIASLSSHVQEVVADVRRLVHDLRPPALDDRGLVGALAQQAESITASGGPAVSVSASTVAGLPAAVEVAAYRIVSEALTNVARHASATRATVRLAVGDGELLVEVSDDGAGIAPEAQVGVGLVSLRERADELGGRSEVTCPPTGGTYVRAWLPLSSASSEVSIDG